MRETLVELVASNPEGLANQVETLQAFKEVAERLNSALRDIAAKAGQNPIPVSHLVNQIDELIRMHRVLAEGTAFCWPGEVPDDNGTHSITPDGTVERNTPSADLAAANEARFTLGNTSNREAALRTLAEVSQYFREHEPHSPLHLLLDRALRWSRMPITDLYAELLGEGSEGLAKVTLMAGLESYGHSGQNASRNPMTRSELPSPSQHRIRHTPFLQCRFSRNQSKRDQKRCRTRRRAGRGRGTYS